MFQASQFKNAFIYWLRTAIVVTYRINLNKTMKNSKNQLSVLSFFAKFRCIWLLFHGKPMKIGPTMFKNQRFCLETKYLIETHIISLVTYSTDSQINKCVLTDQWSITINVINFRPYYGNCWKFVAQTESRGNKFLEK